MTMDAVRAREFFIGLWTEHKRPVEGYIRRRVGPDEADDVLAETFTIAWRRVHDIPENARAWLFTVAKNVISNSRRSHARYLGLQTALQQQTSTAAATDDVSLRRLSMAWAWQQLSADDREVLALVAWDGLSPGEAAHVLGLKQTTFAMRLHRARSRLEDFMAAADSPASPSDNPPGALPGRPGDRSLTPIPASL
jgi:RNA polymerase sigma-70 factor (ECF subfamily)